MFSMFFAKVILYYGLRSTNTECVAGDTCLGKEIYGRYTTVITYLLEHNNPFSILLYGSHALTTEVPLQSSYWSRGR